MGAIKISAQTGNMAATLTDVPAFPGEVFGLGFPEAIGDAARTHWFGTITPTWEQREDGAWEQKAAVPGELSYTLTLTSTEDTVDAWIELTNHSDRTWEMSLAFNCVQCGPSSIRDHECLRHWVRAEGEFRRLVEIPRHYGPRPTIQLYSVEGAPPGRRIPFVANFDATPEATLEGWMAIQSRDGERLVATVSRPALFLFQNMEYSCIHSAPGFGRLAPGETGRALTRIYYVRSSLEAWHERITGEMAE